MLHRRACATPTIMKSSSEKTVYFHGKTIKKHLPLIITVGAILMIAAGIYTGEPAAVWQKAVSICLSCIGIG